MFEKYLQNIGLNDKEASTYLALLSFENASALDLSKKTGIKRPTVYVILESLAKKGLVSETQVGKKVHYYAELPDRLETFIERKIIDLRESQKTLKEIIPQLKSLTRESGEKPIVKYFEGKEGVISANDEIFRSLADSNESMYIIFSKDLIDELFTIEELKRLRRERVSRNVKAKTIYTYTKGELGQDLNSERIKIDSKKYPISCDFTIYKDTVILNVLGKRISSIFIKNQDVAETLKSLFKLVFDLKKETPAN
ncbi:MAG TPA: helix-turn-helix domain-containing protein [Candidatus Paceibacterota bacterium]